MKYGYCRISKPKQVIERQIRNIKAEYPDAVIIQEIFTRTRMDRKEWLRLMKIIKSGDWIIFDSVSRMSGNAEEGFAEYERLYNMGVVLVFLKEPHINTETYKKALENNVQLTGSNVDFILEGVNKYLMALAKEQIKLAFEQSEKEVEDKAKLYDCWQDIIEAAAFNSGFRFLRSCARGRNLPLSEIIRGFCEKAAFIDNTAEDAETRRIGLDGIAKILDDYDEIYGDWQLSARITGVLKFLGTQAADEYKYYSFKPKNPDVDAVQIMTVHKSKGLEFNTVFLPELTKREFPVSNIGGKKYWHVLGGVFEANKDKYQGDLEDERKLFYVAVTRAKQNLYMTYELSAQPVSYFVKESASSHHLKLDRSDLTYNPKSDDEDFAPSFKSSYKSETRKPNSKWEEERRQRQEYWAMVKYARSQLYDYYGIGAHFCPAMYTMLGEIKRWGPEQILSEASRNNLI